jgi:hypothetical protein
LTTAPKPQKEDTILLTGVDNSKKRMDKFRTILETNELKPRKFRGMFHFVSSVGRTTRRIDIVNEDEDVGDYAQLNHGADLSLNEVYGSSDANCFVPKQKKKRLLHLHDHKKKLQSWQTRKIKLFGK